MWLLNTYNTWWLSFMKQKNRLWQHFYYFFSTTQAYQQHKHFAWTTVTGMEEWVPAALLIYKININSISVALSLCLCACCPSLSLPVFVCPICVNGCSLSSSGLHGEEEVVWLRSWSCSTPWWKHSQTRPLIGFRADDLSVLKNTLKPDLTPVQVHCFSQ